MDIHKNNFGREVFGLPFIKLQEESIMEVIKFNDFMDGSYKLLPLEEQSYFEKMIEALLLIGAFGAVIEIMAKFTPIAMEVFK